MGLSVMIQDAVLNWFRGRVFPVPPKQVWLSLHRESPAGLTNELSDAVGGRLAISPADLDEPVDAEDLPRPMFLREIRNGRALLTQPATRNLEVLAVAIWSDEVGGQMLLTGVAEPGLLVLKGDPAVFQRGALRLRATA